MSDQQPRLGYVYFISAPSVRRMKIGWSMIDPDERFRTLLTGSPVELVRHSLVRGQFSLEGELHARFERYRKRGEWFVTGRLLMRYIAENTRPWQELLAEENAAKEVYWAPIEEREHAERREDAACIMKDFRENFDKASTAFMLGKMPETPAYAPKGKLATSGCSSPRGFSPAVQALYEQIQEEKRIAKAERLAKRATLTPESPHP